MVGYKQNKQLPKKIIILGRTNRQAIREGKDVKNKFTLKICYEVWDFDSETQMNDPIQLLVEALVKTIDFQQTVDCVRSH